MYIKKQSIDASGKNVSHGGRGIHILKLSSGDELKNELPQGHHEQLEPFVVPPMGEDGQSYIRDIRVFVVDGKPVVLLERKAEKPLLPENLRGEVVPTIEQIHSVGHLGSRYKPSAEIEHRVKDTATKVIEILQNELHEHIGFMSLDFILAEDGTPLPVDCDVSPFVSYVENIHLSVADALAQYTSQLANTTGSPKQVVIIGNPNEELHQITYHSVCGVLGMERVLFQPSVFS